MTAPVQDATGTGGRRPPAPEELLARLGAVPDGPGALVDAALLHLAAVMQGEGERDGAFRLLAADALLTWACEDALATDDVERALREVLGSVGRDHV